MNVWDLIVVLMIMAVAGGMLLARRKQQLDIALFGALALVIALHGIIDSFRLQMVPAYAAALFLLIGLFLRLLNPSGNLSARNSSRPMAVWRKSLLALVVLALNSSSVFLSMLLPVFTMPEPSGSYGIGTIARHLTDESRDETHSEKPNEKRELMINVWYPVDKDQTKQTSMEHYPLEIGEAISLVFGIPKHIFSYVTQIPTHVVEGAALSAAEASYPIVLFSPGIRSTRFQSMTAIEELVSQGYIVVGIDHPYTSAKIEFPDGRSVLYEAEPEFQTPAELYNHNIKEVAIRAADASFVLDSLTVWNEKDPEQRFDGRLDLSRVGIFGHSYGGATTAETLAQDSRFKAGVSLEGGFWGDVALNGLTQPFMYMMTGDTAKSLDPANKKKVYVFFEEFADDLNSVMTKSTNDTYYMTVEPFIHQSFTDIALLSPKLFAKGVDPEHTVDITRSYVTAFFNQYLKNEPQQPLLAGPSPRYPEVIFDDTYTKKQQ
ncbi:alpha/beta hydrolase family protein [Paenibacillus sinopodophylli]|uniref:alpha/beta hydrolase family protein n=1 Tax=Paenibacillus sinopodophylli TaxID=1837342 RepID=UPI00110CD951|nr:prolyl oligopeptidase family serine peptidase [Paenibacillus sinopodophylli]